MVTTAAAPPYATAQRIGGRSHQCDATAVASYEGTVAHVLLDGMGCSDEIAQWTQAIAVRLAETAARLGDADAALRQVHAAAAAEPGRAEHWRTMPRAVAVVALFRPGALVQIVWCGDARAYRRGLDGVVRRITDDHNDRQDALERGLPGGNRNKVLSFLGDPRPSPRFGARTEPAEGLFLLASDGAYEPLEDMGCELWVHLDGPLDEVAEDFTEFAVSAGGADADNATVTVIDLSPDHQPRTQEPTVSEPTTQPAVTITVYGDRAAAAMQRVTSLLDRAGVDPEEAHELLALIQAGVVESAQGDVLELAERPPEDGTASAVQGWAAAVQAAAAELAHIADRTITRARPAARPAAPTMPPAPRLLTPVDEASREQVEQVLAMAERIFTELTGRTDYSREASLEILPVVLTAVAAEDQAGYIAQLEDFATRNRDRLSELYRKYGPGGELAELERSGLTEQPESIVICERLDAAPMWLQGVWEGELEESMLERFAQLWQFGCDTPRSPQPSKAR